MIEGNVCIPHHEQYPASPFGLPNLFCQCKHIRLDLDTYARIVPEHMWTWLQQQIFLNKVFHQRLCHEQHEKSKFQHSEDQQYGMCSGLQGKQVHTVPPSSITPFSVKHVQFKQRCFGKILRCMKWPLDLPLNAPWLFDCMECSTARPTKPPKFKWLAARVWN